MKRYLVLLAAAAAIAIITPAASMAQIGVDIGVPGVGVRVGEPGYHRYYRDYDEPVVHERRYFRERDVGLRGDCRTITIQRDDGSMKRIRRCD